MERNDVDLFQEWFRGFCSDFHSRDSEEEKNIRLKEEHTFRVYDNIRRIAADEKIEKYFAILAEVVALFHDIGRFPQYRRYKTFKDSDSVNHAALGCEMLVRGKALDKLSPNEQDMIIEAVRHHNVFTVPSRFGLPLRILLGLIRDADKIDIWKVFIDFYDQPSEQRASAVSLGFPDIPSFSPEILESIRRRELVKLKSVTCLNDFKLLQLTWVYDLNFPTSFKMLEEKNYINRMTATLPVDNKIREAVEIVRRYSHEVLEGKICKGIMPD